MEEPVPSNIERAVSSNLEQAIPASMDHAEPYNMDPAILSNLEQAKPASMDHAKPSNMDPAILSNLEQAKPASMDHAEPSNMDPAIQSNLVQAKPATMNQAEPSNMDPAIPSNMERVGPSNMALAEPPNVEQVEAHNVELPSHRVLKINEIFCIIMKMLEAWEQIKLRRVCRSWNLRIENIFMDQEPKLCLKLNVKKARVDELKQSEQERRHVQSWKPNMSVRRMQFELFYKEPLVEPFKQAQFTISDRALNTDAVQVLGRLFSQIQTLIIYWDTEDSEQNIDNLVALLSQVSSGLTTFALIVSGEMNNIEALPKICAALNTHGRPLQQMHLMVPESIEHTSSTVSPGERNKTIHVIDNLVKTTESVTHFSLSGYCSTFVSNVDKLGAKSDTPLDSISLNSMMAANAIWTASKGKFALVKRLQLTDIILRCFVECLIDFLPNVEQLDLTFLEARQETFDFDWIRALKRFTKLTELTLLNFNLDNLSITTVNVDEFVSLNQLQKLTMASPDLFYQFRMANSMPVFPGLISHTIGTQFPGLRELNLWSGNNSLPKADNQTWKEVEQNINAELRKLLPQKPGLQINVQLCHPVMSYEYLTRFAQVRQNDAESLAQHEHL